jgi:hypothetical protein
MEPRLATMSELGYTECAASTCTVRSMHREQCKPPRTVLRLVLRRSDGTVL